MAWEARVTWRVWAMEICVSYITSSAVICDRSIVNAMLSSARSKILNFPIAVFAAITFYLSVFKRQ